MFFYPSTFVYRLELLDKAKMSREDYLNGKMVYLTSMDYPRIKRGQVLDWEELNDRIIREDKNLLKIINDMPYDLFKNTKVIMTPVIAEESGSYGQSERLNIGSGTMLINSVFYHELGHMWAHRYLNNEYDDYLEVREKNLDDVDNTYRGSAIENFAEDFKMVMDPLKINYTWTSFGAPDQRISEKLRLYYNKIMDEYPKKNITYEADFIYQIPMHSRDY